MKTSFTCSINRTKYNDGYTTISKFLSDNGMKWGSKEFDEDAQLNIFFDDNQLFLQELSKITLYGMNKIEFRRMPQCYKDKLSVLAPFLNNFRGYLNFFALHWDAGRIDILYDTCPNIFKHITEELFLSNFSISPKEMSQLLSWWRNIKRLTFSNCNINSSNFYSFDTSIEYKIQEIVLFDQSYSATKIMDFLITLSQTSIVDSLKYFKMHLVKNKEDLDSIKNVIQEWGFNIKFENDVHLPVPRRSVRTKYYT